MRKRYQISELMTKSYLETCPNARNFQLYQIANVVYG